MCLYTKLGKFITQEPIVCYKILLDASDYFWKKSFTSITLTRKKKIYVSPFLYFEYKFGITYKTELEVFTDCLGYYRIEEGFHAYKTEDTALHFLSRHIESCVITKCIIPKGSEVYLNETEIVSNKIIVDSLI